MTQVNDRPWPEQFVAHDREALAGTYLPLATELLCGMHFLGDDMEIDALEWSDRQLAALGNKANPAPDHASYRALVTAVGALWSVPPTGRRERLLALQTESRQFRVEGMYPGATDFRLRLLAYRFAVGCKDCLPQIVHELGRLAVPEACDNEAYYADLRGMLVAVADLLDDRPSHALSSLAALRDTHEFLFTRAVPAAPLPSAEPVPMPHGLVVFRSLGNDKLVGERDKIGKLFRPLLGKPMALQPVPVSLRQIRSTLRAEFPHAFGVIDAILQDLVARKTVGLRPTVLAGLPGCGKTTFALRLAELIGVPSQTYGCAGVHDAKFTGSSRTWSTGEPSIPAAFIASTEIANPLIILDEIEKAGGSPWNGTFLDSLLPLLEERTASRYFDPFIESEIDLSQVIYLATANDATRLPAPLRDRCRILSFPSPTGEHLPALVPGLLRGIIAAQGLDSRWVPAFTGEELDALADTWPGQSLRSLQRLLDGVLRSREQASALH
jgi:hypothetical protein